MILTCPECATSYFVDDSRIASAGRSVKCTSCGARWTAFKAGDDEVAEPAPAPIVVEPPKVAAEDLEIIAVAPEPPPEPVAAPVAKPGRDARRPAKPAKVRDTKAKGARPKALVWIVSAAVAAGLIVAAVVFRRPVVGLVPALAPVYAAIGLPVDALVIEGVKVQPTFEAGRPVLAVSGSIRNSRSATENAPAIRIELLDSAGKALAAKVAHPIDTAVPGHATRHFAITIVDPPAGIHDLAVSFEPQVEAKPAPPHAAEALIAADEAKPLAPGTPDALPEHDAAHHE